MRAFWGSINQILLAFAAIDPYNAGRPLNLPALLSGGREWTPRGGQLSSIAGFAGFFRQVFPGEP